MKAVAIFLSVFLLLPASRAHSAWNWNGTLRAKVQADNRYTRYIDESQVFGEIWGSFEAFDNDSWRASLDFVTRQSSEYGFEGDIYQLYVEKQIGRALLRLGAFSALIAWVFIVWMALRCCIRCQNMTYH